MRSFRAQLILAAAMVALAPPAWSQSGGRSGGSLEGLMSQIDRDGDGVISRSEMDAAQTERFATLDVDGDGLVSEAEFVDAVKDRGRGRMAERMAQRFTRTDADGDGFATPDEFAEAGSARITFMDTDGDGLIAADEMRDALQQAFSRRGE